jgi:hypothetical protein
MIAAPLKVIIFVAVASLVRTVMRRIHTPTAQEQEQARKWFESLSASERARVQRGMVNGNIVEAWWCARAYQKHREAS